MKRLGVQLLLGCATLALAAFSPSVAQATPITSANVGIFSFDELIPSGPGIGVNAFNIQNLTGQPANADFPLISSATFTSVHVVVTDDQNNQTTINPADFGPGFASDPNLLFPATTLFKSAVLTGSIAVVGYAYDDGLGTVGTFTPTNGMFTASLPLNPADPINVGDLFAFSVDGTFEPRVPTEPAPVPEPATIALVGTGIGAVIRARSRQRSR